MLLMAGEEHVGSQVFAGELLPWRRQVFLLVDPFHFHIQNHMKQLGILFWRVARVQFWSEQKKSITQYTLNIVKTDELDC